MRFAMLICGSEEEWGEVGSETDAQHMELIRAWVAKWRAAGKMLPGGEELDTVRRAKTIRSGPDGKPMVIDGPYLELKEVVGGFLVLEAEDIDEAVAIAAEWPLSGSSSVEVRPCVDR
jgi:hypothetical protein